MSRPRSRVPQSCRLQDSHTFCLPVISPLWACAEISRTPLLADWRERPPGRRSPSYAASEQQVIFRRLGPHNQLWHLLQGGPRAQENVALDNAFVLIDGEPASKQDEIKS